MIEGAYHALHFIKGIQFVNLKTNIQYEQCPALSLSNFSTVPVFELSYYQIPARNFIDGEDGHDMAQSVRSRIIKVQDFWSVLENKVPILYKVKALYAFVT